MNASGCGTFYTLTILREHYGTYDYFVDMSNSTYFTLDEVNSSYTIIGTWSPNLDDSKKTTTKVIITELTSTKGTGSLVTN